jgi:hypothetical protein
MSGISHFFVLLFQYPAFYKICREFCKMFSVLAFRGKDSRFALEQNLGPTVVGDQKSGRLYQQTKELRRLGAKLTFSGDTLFLLRLILGKSNEKANAYPSRLPLHVTDTTLLPTTCHPDTGKRTDLEIPFRDDIPKESLVSMDDVRCVCPDTTHMITRCVERDLKRMAQKIVDDKHPHESGPIRRLENNLTMRDAKKPVFQFNRTTPAGKPGKVSVISLSGTGALTTIADAAELQEASNEIVELYDGVWSNEILSGTSTTFANSVNVLRSMFPELFNKINPVKPNDGATYMSVYDASDLLRRSLNRCVFLLRTSKDGLDIDGFSHWAEAYYQTSLLLFGEKGLTPYKLKLTLFPSLVKSGFITSPWFHMCEGLEKSNHHAHKDFQVRTMRGGGLIHHQDPLFLECCFSYCKFLKLAVRNKATDIASMQSQTSEVVYGAPLENLPSPSYLEICKEPCEPPTIPVGESRESMLAGLRFFVAGFFTGTRAVTAGKSRTPNLSPHDMVEHWIRQLGGEILSKDSLEILFYRHSQTPHCFIVLKDDEELKKGTMTAEERATRRRPRCETTTDNDSDTSRTNTARVKLTPAAKMCREFAGGDMTFLKLDYIIDSLRSDVMLDPYSQKYILLPGSDVKKVHVNDIKPLLMHQINQDEGTGRHVSAVVALKRHHKMLLKTASENNAQTTSDDAVNDTDDEDHVSRHTAPMPTNRVADESLDLPASPL